MNKKIILASKSEVRKKILKENNINCVSEPSNVDEEIVKESMVKQGALPLDISKNLAELKANKISQRKDNELVIGADSIIDLNGEIISKPTNREEALTILKKLNGKKHYLISSVCISKNGSMIWNYSDKDLYAYNVYQIEGEGRNLFSKIDGDENTIMGLPVKKIKEYLKNL